MHHLNVKGTSGRYWKGIFTEPRIWDGIDLSKYKVARTAMGPCPMTTVVEDGVTKSRCFFYLYEAAHDNCKSNPGLIPNNPFYNKDRHYPRIGDVNQVTNMNMARANGININVSKIIALVLSNGLVALSGALLSQYQGYADINMGRGAIVIGLAAVIIGEVIFGKIFKNFALKLLSVAIGGIIYYIVMQFVIKPSDH